ncbi:Sensor protein ZraS [Phycisphaerae bacterium RAS1]|nr:Sensor protein ZraS [Phycisphaerae bacterium RAS1]
MPDEVRPATAADAAGGAKPDLVLPHLDDLPTLAPIAVRLLSLTLSADSGARDLADALRADQSLTAKLLACANSAAAGASHRVDTVDRAVTLLGFAAVRNIVLAVKVFECFSPAEGGSGGFSRLEFWKHALAVASAAKRLAAARRELGVDPEDAFVAGLLHDIGKVALDAVFPKAYARVVMHNEQERGDIADFERSILGADHTVAGRRLAERWGLPAHLRDVIWAHHLSVEMLPRSVARPALISLVHLADVMARENHIGFSGNHLFHDLSARLAVRLGFKEGQIETVVQQLAPDVAAHATALGLNRETPESVYRRAMSEANVELGKLNADLILTNRRLAAAARYFKALGRFDRQLSAWSDPAAVVAAMADAAGGALQRCSVAAFGVQEGGGTVNLAWSTEEPADRGQLVLSVPEETVGWLAQPGEALDLCVIRAPQPVRTLMAPVVGRLGRGTAWFVPVVHDARVSGGLVYLSDADERARLVEEAEELRSLTHSFGLVLGRANAQAAARRLSDDLAEMNRRLQNMQVELLRSRTLSMIAEMAAGAAHELNTPLAVISGRAEILMRGTSDPELRRALELIHAKAHECSGIVSELMDFARPRPPEPAPIDLAAIASDVRSAFVAKHQLPESRVTLETDAGATRGGCTISGDANQLAGVLAELLNNALDATNDNSGVISIRCRASVTGDGVELAVRDYGAGMAPGVIDRAFDPFFSHRRAGRGRGLGLARVHRIVEAHRGKIWIDSRPGEGTTVHVLLPKG